MVLWNGKRIYELSNLQIVTQEGTPVPLPMPSSITLRKIDPLLPSRRFSMPTDYSIEFEFPDSPEMLSFLDNLVATKPEKGEILRLFPSGKVFVNGLYVRNRQGGRMPSVWVFHPQWDYEFWKMALKSGMQLEDLLAEVNARWHTWAKEKGWRL